MAQVRPSAARDIPAQRALWALAFGDSAAYIDNFYSRYYRPERVLVLEGEGELRCMAAWFDTLLVLPGRGDFRTAYLYAVATHPDFRGRGLAGELLAGADGYFRKLGFSAAATVPAELRLHGFFARSGFGECFTHGVYRQKLTHAPTGTRPRMERLEPSAYARARERLLARTAHISLDAQTLAYQEGCCAVSGGGLYRLGEAILCAEGTPDGKLLVKELLGQPEAARTALEWLPVLLPAWSGEYRVPGGTEEFGMLKRLDPAAENGWEWPSAAYLGLAFD